MTDDGGRKDLDSQIQAQIANARAQIEATNERVNARAGRNLPVAIGIALALGVVFLLSLIWIKSLFILVGMIFVGFTLYELASALRFAGRDVPRIPLVVVGIGVMPLAYFYGGGGLWLGALAAIVLVSLWRLLESAFVPRSRTSAREGLHDVAAGAFCIAYIAVLAGFPVLLTAREGGEWWTLSFIILTTVLDSGALASGVLFGKTPLAPRISPSKTIEGLLGAALLTTITGVLLAIFLLDQPWWVGVIFGVAIVCSGTIGDLAESVIKRDLGIKDIGSFLPGHGGFLDRLDSVIVSGVVAYALYAVFA
ncbi:phosphatidate cytidylyltransferase [Humidisolicoccus flavus]|uniref:phosphatidate cytidylyltransferase n=1 Tax=Humidisolicoccus flavus TaxID=3111414 RepID=UPI003256773C